MVARVWGLVTLVGFAVLALVVGVPQGSGGSLIAGSLQTQIELALLGLVALAVVVAWRWEAAGGALAVVAATAVGVFAVFEYRLVAALASFAVLLVPGLVFLASWLLPRRRRWSLVAALLVVVLLVGTGLSAQRAYDSAFGPTHPESPLRAEPVDLIEWAWSGGLTPTGVRVTARLDDPADGAHLVVSTSADLAASRREVAPARSSDGGHVLGFEVDGLRPGTRYFYAVAAHGRVDRVRAGRFRTPRAGAQSFTLAFGGCARSGSNGAVFDTIRGLDPLLYLILGDMYYADIDRDDPGRFRDELDRALTRPAQQALYLSTPVAYVWDDHDYGPNDSDSTSPAREAAQSVYREYVPHYPLPGGAERGPIQQAFTLGRARVIVTDARSERTPSSAPDDARKSILGAAQRAWLERELLDARDRYPLILLVTSVPWIGAAAPGSDSWTGYAAERRAVSRFIADNDINGVVMLAGDAHMVALDDGSNSDYSGTGRARVPVLHGAALDRRGEQKGGPYSHGTHPGSGQFATVSVDDDGHQMTVTLRGLDWTGRELVSQRIRMPAA